MNYDEKTIAKVMDTLSGHELVSDERFAEQWVHHRSRKYGKNRIAQELKMKGVGQTEMQKALETLPEEDEFFRAMEQAKKLSRRMQGDKNKIMQALVRRGYGWSMARKAAEAAEKE